MPNNSTTHSPIVAELMSRPRAQWRTVLAAAIVQFLVDRLQRDRDSETLRHYSTHLGRWLQYLLRQGHSTLIADITADHITGYYQYLQLDYQSPRRKTAGLEPASIDADYRTQRAFWNYLAKHEVAHAVTVSTWFSTGLIPRPSLQQTIRPMLSDAEIEALRSACRTARLLEEVYRNLALLLLFLESGVRVAEACGITDSHVDLANRRAIVVGKGGAEGWIFWGPDTAAALDMYLRNRRGPEGGPLFRGINSRNSGGPLQPDAIRTMMERLARRAGVQLPRGCPVHVLRHTFARRMLRAGVATSDLQQLLRHRQTSTTLIYARQHPDELQRAHQRALDRLGQ